MMKTLLEIQDEYCLIVLEMYHGNRTQAARALGITHRTLRNYIARYREHEHQSERLTQIAKAPRNLTTLQKQLDHIFPTNKQRLHYLDNNCPALKRYDIQKK